MSEAPDLLPCPFCSDDLMVTKSNMAVHTEQSQGDCILSSLGIPADDPAQVRRWNTRADLSPAIEVKQLAAKVSNLIVYAKVCRSCGEIFDELNNPHTDADCDKRHADWEGADREQIAAAVHRILSALSPAPDTPTPQTKGGR